MLSGSVVGTLCDPMDCSSARLLCPWNFPGKNTGAGCHFLLQRIFFTQGSNLRLLHLPHWQAAILPLVLPRKPITIHIGCVWGGVFFYCRHDTIKLLEENIGKTFSDVNYTSIFLGQSLKAIEMKTNNET